MSDQPDVRTDGLRIPDRDRLAQSERVQFTDDALIVVTQAYCQNGHRLVTRDNVHTSIPNAVVASSDIVNFSGGGPLRLNVPIGIAYKESAGAARERLDRLVEASRA